MKRYSPQAAESEPSLKIRITFKDPDAHVHDPSYKDVSDIPGLSKWIMFGEYVTIEFDPDTQEVRVLRVDELNV